MRFSSGIVILLGTAALCARPCPAQEKKAESPHDILRRPDTPPDETVLAAFYTQRATIPLKNGSILIKAPASARPNALKTTKTKILSILQKADPAVLDRLAASKVEIAIIPLNLRLTDLPEFRPFARKRNAFDQPYESLRGATSYRTLLGVRFNPVMAVGEDDILHIMPSGQSALHHEFGHVLYEFGLSPAQRTEWESLFEYARKRHLFEHKYAMTSLGEFFPELTQVYFDTEPYFCSPAQLARFHPKAYQFLSRVYEGGAVKK